MTKLHAIGPRIAAIDVRSARPSPKTVDPFYLTPEYQAWRAEVIRRSGGRCQDALCRSPWRRGIRLFADHIVEIKDGGAPLDPDNGMTRCGSCHTRKTIEVRAERQQKR